MGGLYIFGGAYTWRGFFSEFYGIKREKAPLPVEVWSACSPRITLKISKIKEITNFPGKTRTLIRSQIRKPHGAGVGRYKDSVARNLAFVYLGKKILSKVAIDIINCGISQI